MKIISFLGFNNYSETTYIHPSDQSKQSKTAFFQEALVEFYQPEVLYVLLTDTVATKLPRGATESNWTALQKRLAGTVCLEPIYNIPERNTPEDIWTIFEEVTKCFSDNDRVIFDVTHSFRSIPIVSLLAVSYLRTVKNITIEALLYGAYEAKNSETNETPTFDLLPIVKLLDWIAATDRFVKVGDGLPLAELLKTAIPGAERQHNPDVRPLGRQLDQAAKIIAQISQAIALARPLETLNLTEQLEEILKKAETSFDQRAKPFNLISEQLLQEYGQFALKEPMATENLAQNLWLQFQMINWYMARGQTIQAMTLAGEWLISVVAYRLGSTNLLDHRKQVGFALNNGLAILQGKQPEGASDFDEAFQALADYQELSQLRGQLSDIRNDLAHVGMRKKYRSAESLQKEAQEKILPKLQAIAETFLVNPE